MGEKGEGKRGTDFQLQDKLGGVVHSSENMVSDIVTTPHGARWFLGPRPIGRCIDGEPVRGTPDPNLLLHVGHTRIQNKL